MVFLICNHCGYEFDYRGKHVKTCTCPDCHRYVKISENLKSKVDDRALVVFPIGKEEKVLKG